MLLGGGCGVIAAIAWLATSRRSNLGWWLAAAWAAGVVASGRLRALPAKPSWLLPAVVLVIVVMIVAAKLFDDEHAATPSLNAVLLAITVGGVYLTTPDTEVVTVLMAAVAPLAAVAVLRRVSLVSGAAIAPVVGILVHVTAFEAGRRPGSFVRATACWGLLALAPLARALVQAVRRNIHEPSAAALAVAHSVVVLAASRAPGPRRGLEFALMEAAAIGAVGLLVVSGLYLTA